MAAKLEKISTPGVYRRHVKDCPRGRRCDCTYVIVYRHRGRQHTETFRTMAEAREGKRKRESQIARGEFAPLTKTTFHDFAREWIDRYQGTGRRGFRHETREEYRALLDRYALRYFPPTMTLTQIDPREIADFIAWLVCQPNRNGGTLSDSSIRNALVPVSACLATARREGVIAHNPAVDAVLPHRETISEDQERRPLSRAQLVAFLDCVQPDYRLLFDLAARTGLRASELLGLDGRHLHLDAAAPYLRVRQRWRMSKRDGKWLGELGPVKTRYGRRKVPLASDIAGELRALRIEPYEPVFPSQAGTRLDRDNVRNRVIRPAAKKASVPWCGFHTFRHTCASVLFAEGRNVVQVQRWLGHHAPSFTLDTYIHLLEDDLGEPLTPIEPPQPDKSATDEDDDGQLPLLPDDE